MALETVGSSPTTHPIFFMISVDHSGGASPSGKARDFDSRIRWFESSRPSLRSSRVGEGFFVITAALSSDKNFSLPPPFGKIRPAAFDSALPKCYNEDAII